MDKPGDKKPAYSGFGDEWHASNLTPPEARRATDWVEARIDRRSMLTNKDRVEDIRDAMWELERDGEIVVHRVGDVHEPVMARTLYGWEKRSRRPISGTTNPAASAATFPAIRRASCG